MREGWGVLWCRSLLSSTGTFWEERLKRSIKTRLTGGLHRMTASMSDLLEHGQCYELKAEFAEPSHD